ncbi:MAG: porin family protein [Verrucomicrobia bacterium]|nr:porin family protein [Verrucomicrobiota bacterium]
MKTFCWLFSMFCLSTAALAQNYQYQYPSDPYSSTPKPQSNYQAPSSYSGGGNYSKLLSYGSLEARYNYYDFDADNLDNSSGFAVGLRAPLFKPLFLTFGLNWMDGTNQKHQSFNLTTLLGGVGAYIPLGQRFHLFGEVGMRFDISDGELSSINPDSFAVYMRPGLRFAATEKWELAASVLFSTTDNLDQNVVEINSYYALLSVLDLGLGVDFASEVNTYQAGVRLRW